MEKGERVLLMSVQMSILKESLELILPDWSINNDMEAVSKTSCFDVDSQQLNQIASLGYYISRFYHQRDTTVLEFSEINAGGYR